MARRSFVPMLFDWPELEETFSAQAGDITISEDESHISVEVPLPGVKEKDIDVTFHEGCLNVKGSREEREEDKKKKFYRRASSAYAYRVMVPGDIDEGAEPEAFYEDGVMTVRFAKQKKVEPKKIQVKRK